MYRCVPLFSRNLGERLFAPTSMARFAPAFAPCQRIDKLQFRGFSSDNVKKLKTWIQGEIPGKQALSESSFETLSVAILEEGKIVHVKLNRPKTLNSMDATMFEELLDIYEKIAAEMTARAVILSGEGGNFCSGLDLGMFGAMQAVAASETCEGRKREGLGKIIKVMQATASAATTCHAPVIAAVDGVCFGAGVDIVTACDMVICTKDAKFSVKEVDLAIVADLGTIQRLPLLVNHQIARELIYTGRTFSGEEASAIGLALKAHDSSEDAAKHALNLSKSIAKKSPLTIRGIKKTLTNQLEEGVQQNLDFVRLVNMGQLYSSDLDETFESLTNRRAPDFRKY